MKTNLVPRCVATALFGILPALPLAADTHGLFTYEVIDGGTAVAITDYPDDATGHVDIPAEIASLPVTTIGDSAFFYCDEVTGFTIPDSVTTIGDWAFAGCGALTDLTLPASVSSLGFRSLADCALLTEIQVDALNVDFSDIDGVLFDAAGDELLQYPGGRAGTYTVPAGTATIGAYSFTSCTGLTEVTIPGSVTNIGARAFFYCSGLTATVFQGDPPTTLGDFVFDDTAPGFTLRYLNGRTGFTEPPWNDYPCEVLTADPLSYEASGDEITITDCDQATAGEFIIPATIGGLPVTVIDDDAIESCGSLTKVTVPPNVTFIGDSAFDSCASLSQVLFQGDAPSLGSDPFNATAPGFNIQHLNGRTGFTGLPWDTFTVSVLTSDPVYYQARDGIIAITGCVYGTSTLVIPDEIGGLPVTEITDLAFQHHDTLTIITIPASVTTIGHYAFAYCNSLTSITIPGSVSSIGDRGFLGCDNLTDIEVDESNLSYSDVDGVLFNAEQTVLIQYPGGKSGDPYTIPASVMTIGDHSFASCDSLIDVIIPTGVTSIGHSAFQGCTSLETTSIPGTVISIGEFAFYGCSNLLTVTIPENVTFVGSQAFSHCDSLTGIKVDESNPSYSDVNGVLCNAAQTLLIQFPGGLSGDYTLPATVVTIGDDSFGYCETLTDVIIPSGVTSIGDFAFYRCTGLETISLPGTVISIGDSAFRQCTSLTSITIPKSITLIDRYAFDDCESLSEALFQGAAPSLGNGVFSGTAAGFTVTYLNGRTGFTDPPWDTLPVSLLTADPLSYEATDDGITITDCDELTAGDFTIPATIGGLPVTAIADDAFESCGNLTGVTIPPGVTSIENSAFDGCASLSQALFQGDAPSLVDDVFGNTAPGFTVVYLNGRTGFTGTPWDTYTVSVLTAAPLSYEAAGDEITITDCDQTTAGVLVIPAEIGGLPVTAIGDYALFGCGYITDVSISTRVISIGDQAFDACSGLETITIPASVATIGEAAFLNCFKLREITVDQPSFSYSDVDGVLFNAEKTLLVWFPSSKPADVYTVPSTVKTIGDWAFCGCRAVTAVSIPPGVISIGEYAFRGSQMTSVSISASVETIGEGAFIWCDNLANIIVDEFNTTYSDVDGVLCNDEETLLIRFPGGRSGDYTVPSTVRTIGSSGFYGCRDLTSVLIPLGVTSIGSSAFRSCSRLTSVNIPAGVSSIESSTFSSCHSLTSITIHPDVSSIGDYAFNDCRNLLQALFQGDAPSSLGNSVFDGTAPGFSIKYLNGRTGFTDPPWNSYPCEVLTAAPLSYETTGDEITITDCDELTEGELTIPATIGGLPVTAIADEAFKHCSNLTGVTIPPGVTSIGGGAFSFCTSLTSITFPEGVTIIAQSVLSQCTSLTSVTIPDSATTIERYAFYSCTSLTSIPIPDYVTTIETLAFANCTSLTSITFPEGVTIIAQQVFSNCTSLASVTVSERATYIALGAFSHCESLTSFNIPPSVEIISWFAFANTGLTGIAIPGSVTTIRDEAFLQCTSLTSITFPGSVNAIGHSAFENCGSLSQALFQGNAPQLGNDVFLSTAPGFTVVYLNGRTGFTDPPWDSYTVSPLSADPLSYEAVGDEITITDCDTAATDLLVIPEEIGGLPVTAIGDSAFDGCDLLTQVNIPEGVTSIGASPFDGCDSLGGIMVDDDNPNYSQIGGVLFDKARHTLLRYPGGMGGPYTIPTDVLTVADQAFFGCQNVTTVEIPYTVNAIGSRAFGDCGALTSFVFSSPNSHYSELDGVLFDAGPTELIQFPGGKSGDYVIPAGVASVAGYAFADCGQVTMVTIPASVTSIGSRAFFKCRDLGAFEVDSGNSSFATSDGALFTANGETLLYYPSGKTGAYAIPPGVLTIRESAFSLCPGLTGVTFPPGLTTLESKAFRNCSALTDITFPSSVTSIGDRAFRYCSSLGSAVFQGNAPGGFGSDVFSDVGSPFTIRYFSGRSGFNEPTWNGYGCEAISAAPLSFEVVGDEITITDCDPAASGNMDIPAEIGGLPVTAIGSGAFFGCTALGAAHIPASVTSIGELAFGQCSALQGITVDPTNPNYSDLGGILFDKARSVLLRCPGGWTGTCAVPAGVTTIGPSAFAECAALTGVSLPEGLHTIGSGAFGLCTGLAAIELPASLTTIEPYAFLSCGGLSRVNLPAALSTIGEGAFLSCFGLTEAIFHGEAPATFGFIVFDGTAPVTILYLDGAAGFSTPDWNGYTAYPIDEVTHPAAPWLLAHNLPYDSDLDQDLNGDGVTLMMAYALDLNPHDNLAGSMPPPELGPGTLGITFFAASPGVTYSVLTSTDLLDWTSDGVTLSAPDASGRRTATVDRSVPRRFLKLEVGR